MWSRNLWPYQKIFTIALRATVVYAPLQENVMYGPAFNVHTSFIPRLPDLFSHALIRSCNLGTRLCAQRHQSLSTAIIYRMIRLPASYIPDEFMEILGLHDREPHAWIGVKHNRLPDTMIHHLVPPIKQLHKKFMH